MKLTVLLIILAAAIGVEIGIVLGRQLEAQEAYTQIRILKSQVTEAKYQSGMAADALARLQERLGWREHNLELEKHFYAQCQDSNDRLIEALKRAH